MVRITTTLTGVVSAALLVAGGSSAYAASVEDFHLNFDVSGAINTNFDGDGRDKGTYSSGTVTAEATAWANTYDNPTNGSIPGNDDWINPGGMGTEYASSWRTALVRFSGNGIGVQINPPPCCDAGNGPDAAEAPPEHALDNNVLHEFVLFEFNKAVTIKEAALGWPDSGSSLDTDFTFLAYTGNGISGNADAALQDGFGDNIEVEMALLNSNGDDGTGTVGFTAGGWEMFNAFDMPKDNSFVSIGNTNNVASTYWLVGAQNQQLLDSNTVHRDHHADYGKLLGLKGHVPGGGNGGGGGGNAPEPGTLALLGLGMIGFIRRRRQ